MAQQNDAPFNLLRDDAERCGHTGPAASPEGREAELRIPGARLDRPNFHGSPDVIDPFGVITGKERKRIGQRHIVEAGDRGGASNSMTWPKGRNPSAAPMSRYAPTQVRRDRRGPAEKLRYAFAAMERGSRPTRFFIVWRPETPTGPVNSPTPTTSTFERSFGETGQR